MTNRPTFRLICSVLTLISVVLIAGCGLMSRDDPRVDATGGNIERGKELARTNGCIVCHSVPDEGWVQDGYGPDLEGFANNRHIAGQAVNEPDTLIAFLMSPQSVVPGTSMPTVGLTEDEARDIATWLYSLDD